MCKTSTVLIVDDEPECLNVFSRLLQDRYNVLEANSVADAEKIIKTTDVDVVLCDHEMPGEKGLDFFTRLRRSFPNIQRILLTGYTNEDMFLRAINDGQVYKYLVKTSDLTDVIDAVEGALSIRRFANDSQRIYREHLAMKTEKRSLPYLYHRFKIINGGVFALLGTGVISIVIMVILGVSAILFLYFLKSSLGINLFQDIHFTDLF